MRPVEQFWIVNIPGSVNIPSAELTKQDRQDQIQQIAKDHDKVYVMCRRGNASRTATKLLLDAGLENVYNVRGGITEYVNDIDSDMPMY